jgi:hypothetical protein
MSDCRISASAGSGGLPSRIAEPRCTRSRGGPDVKAVLVGKLREADHGQLREAASLLGNSRPWDGLAEGSALPCPRLTMALCKVANSR